MLLEVIGCVFIITLGCLGHFIFEWSGHKKIAGLFFAVNESTWEHIKLTIYPSFLWLIPEAAVRGLDGTLLVSQFASMVTMILLVPGLFYGYTAITRKNWLISDIICFCVAVAAGMWVFDLIHAAGPYSTSLVAVSLTGLCLIALAYFRFSYYPPRNFLFKDPVSGGFGPKGHDCDADFHHQHSHHHHH